MAVRIEERVVVRAPVASVWDFLIDPRRVVTCVPGGALDEVVDERTFRGRLNVKIGALAMAYRGRVWLDQVDVPARRVRIVGEALEGDGAGSARMTLDSRIERRDAGSEVVTRVDVDVGGRLVDLGRGFMERLGHEVFRVFYASVRDTVEAEEARRAAVAAGATPAVALPVRQDALRPIPILWRALRAWVGGLLRPRHRRTS